MGAITKNLEGIARAMRHVADESQRIKNITDDLDGPAGNGGQGGSPQIPVAPLGPPPAFNITFNTTISEARGNPTSSSGGGGGGGAGGLVDQDPFLKWVSLQGFRDFDRLGSMMQALLRQQYDMIFSKIAEFGGGINLRKMGG